MNNNEKIHICHESETCAGDVIKLMDYIGMGKTRSYTLCKVLTVNDVDRSNANHWTYMLIVERDRYPLVISKKCAQTILDDPEKGAELVYNRYMDRYR